MIALLTGIAAHAVALLLYPGLLTVVGFGIPVQFAWMRLTAGGDAMPQLPRLRPTPVVATVALCTALATVQVAAPFNPVAGVERSVVLAAVGLAFTTWIELALTVEFAAESGLLLVVQACWLLAVLGSAVQPESLRPQVLGNLLVPQLLPAKIACGFLYLLCMPALLRLWPFGAPLERRGRPRMDTARILTWFPYCGLFVTLFITPSTDDMLGLLRFFGFSLLTAAVVMGAGLLLRRRGQVVTRGLYLRAVTPYAGLVVLILVATSVLMR